MHSDPFLLFYRVSSKCRGDLSKEKKFSTACPKIKLPQLGQGPRLSHRTDEVHPTLPGRAGGTKKFALMCLKGGRARKTE